MNKRGQATPFIILGIVIVVILIVVISVYKPELISIRLSEGQLEPIRNYIENCVKDVLDESLFVLKENGGRYVCEDSFNNICFLNTKNYLSNNELESQISENVKNKLEEDCNLNVFEQYEIKSGDVNVETEIGWHETIVNANYPIKIKKGEIELELNDFSVSKADEFGLMNAMAGKIINKNDFRNFVIDDWKRNSIFKEENIDSIMRINDPYGTVFIIDSNNQRYDFIIGK